MDNISVQQIEIIRYASIALCTILIFILLYITYKIDRKNEKNEYKEIDKQLDNIDSSLYKSYKNDRQESINEYVYNVKNRIKNKNISYQFNLDKIENFDKENEVDNYKITLEDEFLRQLKLKVNDKEGK